TRGRQQRTASALPEAVSLFQGAPFFRNCAAKSERPPHFGGRFSFQGRRTASARTERLRRRGCSPVSDGVCPHRAAPQEGSPVSDGVCPHRAAPQEGSPVSDGVCS